jgi:hypothetical protein
MKNELNHLEASVAEFDYLMNEGVVVSETERARLTHLAAFLSETAQSFDTRESMVELNSLASMA